MMKTTAAIVDITGTSACMHESYNKEIVAEAIVAVMGNHDACIRCSAAKALGNIKAKEAVKHLMKYLKDSDPDVRSDAASALGKIGDRGSVASLIHSLEDEDGIVRISAIKALADIGDILAVEPLIQSMNSHFSFPVILGELSGDYQWEIRERAAETLGRIKDQRAVQALIEILKDEDADIMLGTIFQSLVQQGDRKGIDVVASYLKHEDISVRRKASRAFICAHDNTALDYLKEALVDEDATVKCNAIEAIGNIGSEKESLLFVLLLKDEDVDVRKTAAKVMVKIDGKKAAKHILPLLHDVSSDVRRVAVELLGNMGNAEYIEPVINMLKDSANEVCDAAITLAGRLKDSRAVNLLITILKDKEKDKMLRSKAILALADIGQADGLNAVLGIMTNRQEDLYLRQMVFKSLKRFDKRMVVDNISKPGNTGNEFVQLELARSLRDFNDAKSEAMLFELMNSENEAVKKEAALSLCYRGNGAALDVLAPMIAGEDIYVIEEVCNTIKNVKSEKVLKLFMNLLESENAAARYSAVKAMGYTLNKGAVPAVIGLLKDDNKDVRREAVVAIGRLCDKRGLAPLVSALYDYERFNDMRKEIAISCKNIAAAAAIKLIVDTLDDKSKNDCHWIAIEALSEIYGMQEEA
ncbi:MAG: HEAT repeat domain-containing protein [Deltaproteobacteria bacterium]|nr:HEAT repeat domain-containing protein [Deltaproteobacteria bacterium]